MPHLQETFTAAFQGQREKYLPRQKASYPVSNCQLALSKKHKMCIFNLVHITILCVYISSLRHGELYPEVLKMIPHGLATEKIFPYNAYMSQ